MHKSINTKAQDSHNVIYFGLPIRLVSSRFYHGCNLFHSKSVIRQRFDFGPLTEEELIIIDCEFAQRFLKRFLGLCTMTRNNGLKQDFINRLSSSQGVCIKEILLEAILAIETSVAFSKHELYTADYAAIHTHDKYTDLIWESSSHNISRHVAEIGLLGILDLLPNNKHYNQSKYSINFQSELDKLHNDSRRKRLAPSTSVIKLAAKELGMSCNTLGTQHLVLGEGCQQHHFYASMTDETSIASQKICLNKRQTNRRLSDLRLPVARQIKVGSVDEAYTAADKIGFPVVIKPIRGNKGHAVTANVTSHALVENAFKKAHISGSDVLIEQHIHGDDFRLLVVGGKFAAAVMRLPPIIKGNGIATVEELINQLNQDPYRDNFRGFPVTIDTDLECILKQAGLSLNHVLETDRSIALRSNANVSTGGIPIDVTDRVHPDNRDMAERSAAGVGLNIAGVDFITTNISRSYRKTGGAIIEINARPGLDIHIWPRTGVSRNVAVDLLKHTFPECNDGRIPIIAVAGDKGTGSPARWLDIILRGSGKSVALLLRNESYLNGKSAELSPSQQKKAATIMLRDPDVEALITTISLRRSALYGLGLNHCSVSIIMDKYLDRNSDLFYKGLDIVKKTTSDCIVVDADNNIALNRVKNASAKHLILVSENFNNPTLHQHLSNGHSAVTRHWINGKYRILLMAGADTIASFATDTPCIHKSFAMNKRIAKGLMFAIAAAKGMGMSGCEIQRALNCTPIVYPILKQ